MAVRFSPTTPVAATVPSACGKDALNPYAQPHIQVSIHDQ
jgi:hypothetical protein